MALPPATQKAIPKATLKKVQKVTTTTAPPLSSPPPPPLLHVYIPSASAPKPKDQLKASPRPQTKPFSPNPPLLPNPSFTIFTLRLVTHKTFQKRFACFDSPRTAKKLLPTFPKPTQKLSSSWTKILPKKARSFANNFSTSSLKKFLQREMISLKNRKKCFNCLFTGHSRSSCYLPRRCLVCRKFGHDARACSLLSQPDHSSDITNRFDLPIIQLHDSFEEPFQQPAKAISTTSDPSPLPIVPLPLLLLLLSSLSLLSRPQSWTSRSTGSSLRCRMQLTLMSSEPRFSPSTTRLLLASIQRLCHCSARPLLRYRQLA